MFERTKFVRGNLGRHTTTISVCSLLPTRPETPKTVPTKTQTFCALTRSDINALINKITDLLVKAFVSCIIWFVLGEFCPALREKLPDYYAFVDAFLAGFNNFFKHAIEFLKWGIHVITLGHF